MTQVTYYEWHFKNIINVLELSFQRLRISILQKTACSYIGKLLVDRYKYTGYYFYRFVQFKNNSAKTNVPVLLNWLKN